MHCAVCTKSAKLTELMGISQAGKVIKLLGSGRSQECDFLGLTIVCIKLVTGHQARIGLSRAITCIYAYYGCAMHALQPW